MFRRNQKNDNLDYNETITTLSLHRINVILNNFGKTIFDFGFPQYEISHAIQTEINIQNNLIQQEINGYDTAKLEKNLARDLPLLNIDQKCAYETILNAVNNKNSTFGILNFIMNKKIKQFILKLKN